MGTEQIVQAIAVTAELTQTVLSASAMVVMADDLMAEFSEEQILRALHRCRNELKGRLTPAAIRELAHENDGRPGIEEAWAMCPKSEADSVCWTLEMREAYFIAQSLADDRIAARMAFKDAYERLVRESRENGFQARWELSLGHDVDGRTKAVEKAVTVKAISQERAVALLPNRDTGIIGHLLEGKPLQLEGPEVSPAEATEIRARIASLRDVLRTSAERRAAQKSESGK